MKAQITKKVGKVTFTFIVEEEKEVDALAKAAFYATTPDKCTLCKSENVSLEMNKAQDFTFVKVRCLDCRAQANLGQFKDGSGCFWKDFKEYTPEAAYDQAKKTFKKEE